MSENTCAFLHADGIVSLGLSYEYDSLEDLETAAESCPLFTEYEYSLLREEPLPAEGEGRAECVYLFPAESNDHLDEGDFYGYNYRTAADGIELTLYRYQLNVAGTDGETAEFLAADIRLQNKELSVRREDWRYLLTANEPAEPNPYPDLYPCSGNRHLLQAAEKVSRGAPAGRETMNKKLRLCRYL